MKGRAYQLVRDFEAKLTGARASFLKSRLILMARVVPEKLTPDTDDPDMEQRIIDAIHKIQGAT